MEHNRQTEMEIPFPDELAHLEEINQKLASALSQAEANVERIDTEYMDTKRYMADYRGELDPHEMFQNELLLRQTDHTGAFAVSLRDKLAKQLQSPYFARVDFLRQGAVKPAIFYIGSFSFNYDNKLLIFDWRAPVAGMFYDCETGPAGYDAPKGRIEGTLTRKRQFKITNGVMEYALESGSRVQDETLQRELSLTSDEKMKSIIATIQKEQNLIIRNDNAETLIIQGVAGSGKTSIALHRIAYLLYRFKTSLSSRNVAILSPNRVFGDFISNVIPELGEEPICELDFPGIAEAALENSISFVPDPNPLEVTDQDWKDRTAFKSTLEFVRLLDDYIAAAPERIFQPQTCCFGSFQVSEEWLRERFRTLRQNPIKQRLSIMAEELYSRFESDPFHRDDLPKKGDILKALQTMLLVKNPLAFYREFYKTNATPQLFVLAEGKRLEWADIFPYLYLRHAFEGLKVSTATKHLVIDEMQDYTPIQYAVLNLLFPCKKTILGDFGQLLNPCHTSTLKDLRMLYHNAQYAELNKSYRSTYEIISFAAKIHLTAALEPVERHGQEPAIVPCQNYKAELEQIHRAISDFQSGKSATLGIILKTDKDAGELYAQLSPKCQINRLTPESTAFQKGVTITSIQMSKGLEFDEVLIPQADDQTYFTQFDRCLLYIACTRAMHRLTLFHTGAPSRLLPES